MAAQACAHQPVQQALSSDPAAGGDERLLGRAEDQHPRNLGRGCDRRSMGTRDIWDALQPTADELSLTEEQREIVDRRLEEHRRDPSI